MVVPVQHCSQWAQNNQNLLRSAALYHTSAPWFPTDQCGPGTSFTISQLDAGWLGNALHFGPIPVGLYPCLGLSWLLKNVKL